MATDKELRDQLYNMTIAPDEILLNNKKYELVSTQLSKKDALEERDFCHNPAKVFKYSNGYAIYEYRG